MAEPQPTFLLDRRDDRVVITFTESSLSGRESLEAMFRRFDEALNMTPSPKFVFSFARVNHISSIFIGLLLAFRKRVEDRKGSITLIAVNEQVMEVFRLTRLDQQFTIRQSAPSLDTTDPGSQRQRRGWLAAAIVVAVIAAAALIWSLVG